MREIDIEHAGKISSPKALSEMLADSRIAETHAFLRKMEEKALAGLTDRTKLDILRARYTAARLRVLVVKMVQTFGEGHLGSPFSIIEILYALYSHVLKIENPQDEKRDRFILSKGHACAALYAILADRGYLCVDELENYSKSGSRLPGHPTASAVPVPVPGIEISTGSLGNGLSPAVGFALAGKLRRNLTRVFVLTGDGELDEGVIWEAAMFSAHHDLDNLTLIIDRNGLQIAGRTEDVMRIEPLTEKWSAFGWNVINVDGHDHASLVKALRATREVVGRPSAVIANTKKGAGVSFMENSTAWHYRTVDRSEAQGLIFEIVRKLGA